MSLTAAEPTNHLTHRSHTGTLSTPSTNTSLHARNISVKIDRRRIVDDVSFDVEAGQWLAIIGPNGAGKSTLLKAIAGLINASGTVEIGRRSLLDLGPRERARNVAMVAQSPVIPEGITVEEYVQLGRTPHLGWLVRAGKGDGARIETVLRQLDSIDLRSRQLSTLSGGERQRVLIARALVQDTKVLLLDEPTTALDVGHQQDVMELIDRLRRENELTVVSTLHDLTAASHYPDRVLLLHQGAVSAIGTPTEVLTESNLATYYGADVRVLTTDDGVVIAPRRKKQ